MSIRCRHVHVLGNHTVTPTSGIIAQSLQLVLIANAIAVLALLAACASTAQRATAPLPPEQPNPPSETATAPADSLDPPILQAQTNTVPGIDPDIVSATTTGSQTSGNTGSGEVETTTARRSEERSASAAGPPLPSAAGGVPGNPAKSGNMEMQPSSSVNPQMDISSVATDLESPKPADLPPSPQHRDSTIIGIAATASPTTKPSSAESSQPAESVVPALSSAPSLPEVNKVVKVPNDRAIRQVLVGLVGAWKQVGGGNEADFVEGGYQTCEMTFTPNGVLRVIRIFDTAGAIRLTREVDYILKTADNVTLGESTRPGSSTLIAKEWKIPQGREARPIVITPAKLELPQELSVRLDDDQLVLGGKTFRRQPASK